MAGAATTNALERRWSRVYATPFDRRGWICAALCVLLHVCSASVQAQSPDTENAATEGDESNNPSPDAGSSESTETGAAQSGTAQSGTAQTDGEEELQSASEAAARENGEPDEEHALHGRDIVGWRDGRARGFVAGSLDLGFLFVRPRLQVGWGKPNHAWVGIEINPTIWFDSLGGYSGIRLRIPNADLRFGGRFTRPNNRSHLPLRDHYTRTDLNSEIEGADVHYFSVEAELTLTLPLGRGTLYSDTTVTHVSLVPQDSVTYEDFLRVVVRPPWIWRQRVGYEYRFGRTRALRLGVVAELLGVPRRDMLVFRAGLRMRLHATPQLEVRASWIPALFARDQLGIRGGDFGLLGLRYRWATGGVDGSRPERTL